MKTVVYIRAADVFNDSRATKEIRALIAAGYRVVILGWDRSGKSEIKCRELFSDCSNVGIDFYPAVVSDGLGLRNIDKLLGWVLWVGKKLKQLKHVDIVHACDLDAGMGAFSYCRRKRIPLVYDIYDYYVDSHYIPSVAVSLVERMEIALINLAQITIICTEERREQIAKAKPRKVIVVHNSPDIDEYQAVCEPAYDYIYCGGLNDRRLVREILEGYESNCDLKFFFAGHGTYVPVAERLSEQYENFTFAGSLTYAKVLEEEAKALAIAAIYEPTIRNHRLCAPNKFYEALALGKPIIVCKGTGIDKIVEEHAIGTVIDYSAEEFYHALRALKADPELCMEMGQRARKLYEDKYRWSKMEKVLLDAYENI